MTNNSKYLISYNKKAKEEKIKAVKEAVSYCLYNNEVISINKIAKKAQVSRSFIYDQKALKDLMIEVIPTSKVRAAKNKITSGQARSIESKMAIINNLKRSLKDAHNQIDKLKTENAKLRSYISKIEDE